MIKKVTMLAVSFCWIVGIACAENLVTDVIIDVDGTVVGVVYGDRNDVVIDSVWAQEGKIDGVSIKRKGQNLIGVWGNENKVFSGAVVAGD